MANFKSYEEHWLLVVVDAHFAVVLVVLLVLEQRHPLLVRVQTTVQNDELRDRDTAHILSEALPFADQCDPLVGDLGRQWHTNGSLLGRFHALNVEELPTQFQVDCDLRLFQIGFFWLQLKVQHGYLDVVGCT